MKKHVVLIKAKNPDKFNYCKFGNYKNVQGKNVELIDINEQKVSGYEMFQAVVSLDINMDYHKRVYEFLKDHPLIKGNFVIEDLRANEEKTAESAIKGAEAITTASSLSDNEMNDLSILMGLDPNLDSMMLKARLIQYANSNPDKFLSLLNDMDKEHRIFLKKALGKGVLSKPNGVWKHGTLNVGLTDDQAIVWLKDNADVYALLKHQLRTGKIEKVEEEVEEVAVVSETIEPSSISSSTMKELEKDIDNK